MEYGRVSQSYLGNSLNVAIATFKITCLYSQSILCYACKIYLCKIDVVFFHKVHPLLVFFLCLHN